MKLDKHYIEPQLVAMYDIENPRGADYEFYIQLASELRANVIVDLGCGTGLLTRELAIQSRQVIGVDPAAAMLAYARTQAEAKKVQWIDGDASAIGQVNADLVIMTGNVAQVFLDDSTWNETLLAIHRALKSGGTVAFESRNPAIKAWESWNPVSTFQTIETPFGIVESWLEVVNVGQGTVSFKGYNHFLESGEEIIVDSTLRFRTHAEIIQSLEANGFRIETVYGSWERTPFVATNPIMIFVASRI